MSRAASRRSAALRRRPELSSLAAAAEREGIACWIVGGAPRDLLLGRPELDVDVAVTHGADRLATELAARGHGTAVSLSDAPRVVRVAGRRIVDLAELEGGSIERDLSRRDFTANAIAIGLVGGDWIDPHGGIPDVARRRLSLVSAENLAHDPLRAFRAARLYASHDLRPDAAVARAVRRYARGLRGVAAERIAAELARMLEAHRVAPALEWAAAQGVLSPALRIDAPRRAWRRAAQTLARLERRSLDRLTRDRRRRLRLAAIATAMDLSPEACAAWLRAGRHGRAEAASVAELVSLGARALELAPEEEARWEWIRDAGPSLSDALSLAAAIAPRRTRGLRPLRALARRRRRAPAVSGRDVLAWSGVSPGPRVGEILAALEVEGLRGRVRTREAAEKWVRRNAAAEKNKGDNDSRRKSPRQY